VFIFLTLGFFVSQDGEKYCKEIWSGLDRKLKDSGNKGKAKERTMF
jgi:hypothetical protein